MAASPPTNDLNFRPPPTPGHHTRDVIVIVFISMGSLVFLGTCLFGLWCVLRRHRKKKKKMVQKIEDIDVDEHRKVQEMVVQGPHGPKVVRVSMEDEVNVHDKVSKHEMEMVSSNNKSLLHGEGGQSSGGSTSHQLSHDPRDRV